jgi:plasmid stabilization system protein ParE
MIVRWLSAAIDDLESIDVWLSSLEFGDPQAVREKIHATVAKLERLGDIGRPWKKGSRALSVQNAPYVIVFRDMGDHIAIISVLHQARIR